MAGRPLATAATPSAAHPLYPLRYCLFRLPIPSRYPRPNVCFWWKADIAAADCTLLSASMDWPQLARNFEADGSLRDIYIHGTSIDDWASVWAALIVEPSSLAFTVDGEPSTAPLDVAAVFLLGRAHSVCASYRLGNQHLNCHFFLEEEIEFDLDPGDVVGADEAKQLAEFMTRMGRATSKEVRLTLENEEDAIIARYEPATDEVVWKPATV